MLKRKIAGLVIAGLFAGVAQAANVGHPTAGAEYNEPWGKVTYMFNPSAEQLAAEKSSGSFVPRNSGNYSRFGKAEYFFSAPRQQQASAEISALPRAWKQFLD